VVSRPALPDVVQQGTEQQEVGAHASRHLSVEAVARANGRALGHGLE
jgi:hypothetical protein